MTRQASWDTDVNTSLKELEDGMEKVPPLWGPHVPGPSGGLRCRPRKVSLSSFRQWPCLVLVARTAGSPVVFL
jgi:hypothetical protein